MGIDETIDQIELEKSEAVMGLQLFDTNIWLGKPMHFRTKEIHTFQRERASFNIGSLLIATGGAILLLWIYRLARK